MEFFLRLHKYCLPAFCLFNSPCNKQIWPCSKFPWEINWTSGLWTEVLSYGGSALGVFWIEVTATLGVWPKWTGFIAAIPNSWVLEFGHCLQGTKALTLFGAHIRLLVLSCCVRPNSVHIPGQFLELSSWLAAFLIPALFLKALSSLGSYSTGLPARDQLPKDMPTHSKEFTYHINFVSKCSDHFK